MKTITLENIKGNQLPLEWQQRAEMSPDDEVEITISPPRKQQMEELLRLVGEIGRKAKAQGLTEAKLSQLLDEA
jgi:hypothetical protein